VKKKKEGEALCGEKKKQLRGFSSRAIDITFPWEYSNQEKKKKKDVGEKEGGISRQWKLFSAREDNPESCIVKKKATGSSKKKKKKEKTICTKEQDGSDLQSENPK